VQSVNSKTGTRKIKMLTMIFFASDKNLENVIKGYLFNIYNSAINF